MKIIRPLSLLLVGVILFSLAGCAGSSKKAAGKDVAYAGKLFDTSCVHTVNIAISEDDWTDLQQNPTDKTKYQTDITIDGETIRDVSFVTKGNTSLTAVAEDADSSRYSFKVNFGKYVDGQTYYGLNKLSLNNLYADATYMKDYLSYEIFRRAGVDSPLVSYVWLTVNGEDHGLYIAVEDVSESYLERTAGGEGELYKPETSQLANMDQAGGGDKPNGMPNGEMPSMPDNITGNGSKGMPPNGEIPTFPEGASMPTPDEAAPGGFGGGMPGGFGSSSSGANLKYTDDRLESYSDIFDNDETDADDASKERVIAALKALSTGENLEGAIDTDEVIRYFAAHNFVLNYDSYTGVMLHNYYLYENDGKLSMLPWDYNLAFGAFAGNGGHGGSADATGLVNTGIDTPLSGANESDRPMWSWITSEDRYTEQYHAVYDELLSYFESGECARELDRLYELLLPYIEKDTSAFYSADAFQKGYETLKEFCALRAESIRRQLDGKLSTKTDEQQAADQVDASSVTISDMGTHGAGKEMPGGMNGQNPMTPPDIANRDASASAPGAGA